MTRDQSRDIEYLRRILEHQKGIQDTLKEYGSNSLAEIKKSNMCVKALSVDVNQIGEFSKKLSEPVQRKLIAIDFQTAYNIRNRLAHSYTRVKPDEIILNAFAISTEAAINEVKGCIKYCIAIQNTLNNSTEQSQ